LIVHCGNKLGGIFILSNYLLKNQLKLVLFCSLAIITFMLFASTCGCSVTNTSNEPKTKPAKVPAAISINSWAGGPDLILTNGQNLKFESISIEHGLSHSTVNCILQDRYGFMWFGTDDGLNKFDGYSFTVYKHNPDDPHSLSHNQVWSLFEDFFGVLWVGTYGGGLNRFDRNSGQFSRYDSNDFKNINIRIC